MNVDPIARRYADALFDTANEHQCVDRVTADLRTFREILNKTPEFQMFLRSFRITTSQKVTLVRNTFEGKLNTFVLNALSVLIRHKHEALTDHLVEAFLQRVQNFEDIESVETMTAVPLPGELTSRVKEVLVKQLGKKVDLHTAVDKSLIGGIRIRVRNTIYDGSIKHQLEKLREQLR